MRLMLQQGSEEARHQAIKLMGCLIMNIATAYAALDALYVELKVAGGFFRGRKMFAEVDQQMRYELVGYITALTAVLVRETLREPDEVDSIVAALETLVFLPEWQAARPAYHRYVARYRDSTAGDSAVVPRQKVLLRRFRQALIDIWKISPELLLEDGFVQRHSEALSALHEGVEERILKELSNNTRD